MGDIKAIKIGNKQPTPVVARPADIMFLRIESKTLPVRLPWVALISKL